MVTAFDPWEIPTGGQPPPMRLTYDEQPDGSRLVFNHSAWMLLVTRADGRAEPLGHGGAVALQPGDSVTCPPSECAAVDPQVVFRTQLQGIRDYTMAHAPAFDEAEGEPLPFNRAEPERWWWYKRELEHGRVLHLRMGGANARLEVSIAGTPIFQGSWCYPNHTDGWRAALGWNGWQDPPDGWIRHLQTARRRKDGTPESEYYQAAEAPPELKKRRR
jgi:hypothetical protein